VSDRPLLRVVEPEPTKFQQKAGEAFLRILRARDPERIYRLRVVEPDEADALRDRTTRAAA
jgi:hypothetical protein